MRYGIIFSVLAALTLNVSAQTIPNSGFENWTTVGSHKNPDNWSTLNNSTQSSSIYTAEIGTPGNPGSSYLKLTSKTVGSTVVKGIAVCGELDSVSLLPKSGFPINVRPTSLTGKWQHMIYGSSQGFIKITLTKWDSSTMTRKNIGSGNVTLSGMAMSWANFSIPITYSLSEVPDTCIIVMSASGLVPTNRDYLWVDNLAFTGTSSKSIGFNENQLAFEVYPNPSSTVVYIRKFESGISIEKIQICDLQGRIVKYFPIEPFKEVIEEKLNLDGLIPGTYTIQLNVNQQVISKKMIIQ